ncbi:ArsR/SmtB family transcription factor [Aureibacter tunicatorum]|uniref:DNA-binding transcriptional ArsR family regulator n=1 Tax=Aureibacter tunicatorum TaxID=866807 RepID=A0AAE3XQP2_9BACT|nr:metalloregulator ArsR/SmtB family transcription factor [Aureibacter tunicatorum]MDR6240993.1 DNA-binding transcriptional ArsR family regulator [Aureibacter tunicatorum]BDD03772.1 transcriptional regulator [Aureibacter tunicatorum]
MISEIQSENLERAANMLKSIAHPIRLSVVWLLKEGNEMTVTQLHEELGIDQGLTSHYLSKMKEQGVLGSRREGKNNMYFIKKKEILNVFKCMKI